MDNMLEVLLANELPEPEIKEVKIKRLSEAWKTEVIFTIKALSYNKVSEINKINGGDMSIHIMMAGVVSPNLKAKELMEKYNAVTPVDAIKKLLKPGEIEDISRAIERLSGYRITTIEEIKKK